MIKVKATLTKDPEEFQYLKLGEKKRKRMSSSLINTQQNLGEEQKE
jgi:hypothetical protein